MRIYVQLGRLGDILNLLPIAWDHHQSGQRCGIMVAKEFSDVLDGCSYVDKIVFDGKPFEISKAVAKARTISPDVVTTQVLGPEQECTKHTYSQVDPPHAITDSFCREAWRLAGNRKFGTLPIVFDRREPLREIKWLPSKRKRQGRKKKMMLVAVGGNSSPFQFKTLLLEILRLRFPRWNIIDLSLIQVDRFYDLLGLYEAANVLVAADSAPLHLAYAVPTLPVIALINDKPSLWHGASWRPQHVFHCRYGDFPMRTVGMLQAIARLENQAHTAHPSPNIVHTWNAYDLNDESLNPTWLNSYATGIWCAMPFERGAAGRDSQTAFGEAKRLPFVKDILRNACLRQEVDGLICLTRADTCFNNELMLKLTNFRVPVYAHRTIDGAYRPAVDLFAFKKAWWLEHRQESPDFVLGDHRWNRVMLELVKSSGALELQLGTVYQKPKIIP